MKTEDVISYREPQAWIEKPSEERVPIQGTCSIGRAPDNRIILHDGKVSRRHAIIHSQGENEFWLVDLGSSNGTFLNGHRVFQPTKLNDRDQIQIGELQAVFRQLSDIDSITRELETAGGKTKTLTDIKPATCWMLVADIIGSTLLEQTLSADELPRVTGGWMANCKQIIDESGGGIDKFLGDGFFAYWMVNHKPITGMLEALRAFTRLQEQGQPRFRMILHYGQVYLGGIEMLGREGLWGPEIYFAFRMEKLASALKEPRLLSEPAYEQIKLNLAAKEAGAHALTGFKGVYKFWTF